jgi:replicative DNA helicase Mcm
MHFPMELPDQIEKFREFVEVHELYAKELHDQVRKGHPWLNVEFADLAKHSPELADLLLDQPEEILKAFQIAIEKMDLPRTSDQEQIRIEVRIMHLPKEQRLEIRNVRSKHLNRLYEVVGIVRQKSPVRPQMTSARFECPSCGNILHVLQVDQKFKEPSRCGCGRKGKFKMLTKELVDAQSITLEESPDDLEGGEQPKRLKMLLKNDLVAPLTDRRTNPGTKITVVGVIKEVPIILATGGQSTNFDLMCDVNFVESVQEEFGEIQIDPVEEEEIKKLSQDPDLFEKFVASIAPSIYGHEPIKQALILQMFGGVHKSRDRGVKSRGDIHILLIGDPGSGKSQMLKRVSSIAPKARFVSGKGASGAGLCVAPSSLILSNPGGMETIERVVEDRLSNPQPVNDDVVKQDNITDIKIQSLSHDLKLHSQHPQSIWKLKAPEYVFVVTLASGKRIELTGNTQLFTMDGETAWKKSSQLSVGDYVATPRKLIGGDTTQQFTVDLLQSNPVVHGIKPFVKSVTKALTVKYGTLRNAAKKLDMSENALYHTWVQEGRGNIKLHNLKKLCEDVDIAWKKQVRAVSLYNGKIHTIPTYLNNDLLYVAGLIAGDGDMRKSGKTVSIRLSNNCSELHQAFRSALSEFSLSFDVQKGNVKRPEATRTHSKILAEILGALGVPHSPKSDKIQMSNILLHLSNDQLAHYVAGLYDTDGSVHVRKGKGSDCIDLTTCSEMLARQVQLVLLRYGVRATLRTRKPSVGKIIGKHDKWILEIRTNNDQKQFAASIPLRHPKKKAALERIPYKTANTNTDIVPGIGEKVKKLLQQKGIPLKSVGWHEQLSRDALQKIAVHTPEVTTIAHSDIYWEKIVNIKKKKTDYEYVYDLTVENSHNFVVDGILVHNTAAVVKDDFLKGWTLEAGALVLANRGLCCIDELDKMTKEDTSAMHEALEQQQISIAKANIQATLRSETTVLAAANPKFGRFDPYEMISKQIDLPPALINRFDLIFPVRDLPDKTKDEKLASFILSLHKESSGQEGIISPDMIKKYIAYARQHCYPKLTESAIVELKDYYVKMRGGEEGEKAIKAIPISARQLEALVRLAEASAKMRLSEKVTKRDAQTSIELIHYCLQQIGLDPDTGKIDIDRITTGISASQRSHISLMKEIIQELEQSIGKVIPIDDVVREAGIKGIAEDTAQDVIEKLKRGGDIYSPKHGFVARL